MCLPSATDRQIEKQTDEHTDERKVTPKCQSAYEKHTQEWAQVVLWNKTINFFFLFLFALG